MKLKPALSIVAALGLAACNKSTESNPGKLPDIKVSEDGDTRVVSSADGVIQAVGTKGGAEARFPDYAPAYPGAQVQASVNMKMGPKDYHNITMLSSDKPEAILAFYEEKAKAAGHAVKMIGGMLGIGNSGPGGMAENHITATPTPTGTSISLMIAQP